MRCRALREPWKALVERPALSGAMVRSSVSARVARMQVRRRPFSRNGPVHAELSAGVRCGNRPRDAQGLVELVGCGSAVSRLAMGGHLGI